MLTYLIKVNEGRRCVFLAKDVLACKLQATIELVTANYPYGSISIKPCIPTSYQYEYNLPGSDHTVACSDDVTVVKWSLSND